MVKQINSAAELVDCLGGSTKLARALGEKQATVGMWKRRNRMPPTWYTDKTLRELLIQHEIEAAASIWGMRD